MLVLLLACTLPMADLARPPTAAAPEIGDARPPRAAGPSGEKLYQLLYAGEMGHAAYAQGQRVRMLAWFDALALTDDQLRGLRSLAASVTDAEASVQRERETLGEREKTAYTPIYDALSTRLMEPAPLTEEEGAAFAARLEVARADVYGSGDPRVEHYARVRALLVLTRPWVASLAGQQRAQLRESRFLLARRLGPFVSPGDYSSLVGAMWDGGDFGSLRATLRPSDEGHLDLGGLWSVEAMQSGPERSLEGLQAEALVLMAALEPELPAAIALRLGEAHGGAVVEEGSPEIEPTSLKK